MTRGLSFRSERSLGVDGDFEDECHSGSYGTFGSATDAGLEHLKSITNLQEHRAAMTKANIKSGRTLRVWFVCGRVGRRRPVPVR